jgi:TRAP-type C4-dicarboxylate transport system permease small subunit
VARADLRPAQPAVLRRALGRRVRRLRHARLGVPGARLDLRRGEHIRVTLFLQRLRGPARRLAELWCLGLGTLLSGYLAWFSVKLCWQSYEINDLSTGLIAIPLWIPQVGMAAGAVILCIAIVEQLVVVATGGPLMEEPSGDEATRLER